MNIKKAAEKVEAIISESLGFNIIIDDKGLKSLLAFTLSTKGEQEMIKMYHKHTSIEQI